MKNLKIKKWLRSGVDGVDCGDTDDLLDSAARALDKAYSHEIMGEILFEAEDGKIYCGCVEFHISEANPEYVKDALSEGSDE